MPISIEIVDEGADTKKISNKVFGYFSSVDKRFSTYKKTSEITRINEGKIARKDYSLDMKTVLKLCEKTKMETNGYFDIEHNGMIDPSGLVKGWSIFNVTKMLNDEGFKNYYLEAGGDIQTVGRNREGRRWKIGIKNPFNDAQIVKVVYITNQGIATSGTYMRGQHIYNPKSHKPIVDIVSLTVIGPNIYEADRFATAAFAMGKNGIIFIESLIGFESFMIDKEGIATMTSGFEKYTRN